MADPYALSELFQVYNNAIKQNAADDILPQIGGAISGAKLNYGLNPSMGTTLAGEIAKNLVGGIATGYGHSQEADYQEQALKALADASVGRNIATSDVFSQSDALPFSIIGANQQAQRAQAHQDTQEKYTQDIAKLVFEDKLRRGAARETLLTEHPEYARKTTADLNDSTLQIPDQVNAVDTMTGTAAKKPALFGILEPQGAAPALDPSVVGYAGVKEGALKAQEAQIKQKEELSKKIAASNELAKTLTQEGTNIDRAASTPGLAYNEPAPLQYASQIADSVGSMFGFSDSKEKRSARQTLDNELSIAGLEKLGPLLKPLNDSDRNFILSASKGSIVDAPSAKLYGLSLQQAAKRASDYVDFITTAEAQGVNNPNLLDQAWTKYTNENPLFSPLKGHALETPISWQDYFNGKTVSPTPAVMTVATPSLPTYQALRDKGFSPEQAWRSSHGG